MARTDVIKTIMNELTEDLDILILDDGDFTGTHASIEQDKIDLSDYGFDDDEIMLIYDIEVAKQNLASGGLEGANDIVGILCTLNKTATAGQAVADDIPFLQLWWNIYLTQAGVINHVIRKVKHPAPVPIIDHFYLHNVWKSGGSDGSGEFQIWIYYKKVKLTSGRLADAIKLLRMAG